MKFAKVAFTMAGILGLLELVPLYFMYNVIGRRDPPPEPTRAEERFP